MTKATKARKPRTPRDPSLPPITRTHIDPKDFIRAVVEAKRTGGNLQSVANQLGCSYQSVVTKFKKFKEAGIPLPDIKGTRGGLDIQGLIAFTEDLIQGAGNGGMAPFSSDELNEGVRQRLGHGKS